MIEYHDILTHASQLPIDDRLRLIDDLASSVPDDHPPRLSPQWLAEINRRSDQIDTSTVKAESWAVIRERLMLSEGPITGEIVEHKCHPIELTAFSPQA